MKYLLALLLAVFIFGLTHPVRGFQREGCGMGRCQDCHDLSIEEASTLLQDLPGRVQGVKLSEVPGLWVVEVKDQEQTIPVYIDFSKEYLITGHVVKIATRQDMTQERFISLNKVDVATIPLDDAIVIGRPEAAVRIIVFSDPECSFCRKLHDEMKKAVALRADIAFFIKMLPLRIHPQAYEKAKAIVCAKSEQLLVESLEGKEIPAAKCQTDQVDKNLELGRRIRVNTTPTLVFPDGRVIPGYKSAEMIIGLLPAGDPEQKEGSGGGQQ